MKFGEFAPVRKFGTHYRLPVKNLRNKNLGFLFFGLGMMLLGLILRLIKTASLSSIALELSNFSGLIMASIWVVFFEKWYKDRTKHRPAD